MNDAHHYPEAWFRVNATQRSYRGQGLGLGFTSNLSNPRALMEFALGLQQPDGTFHGDPGSMTLDGEVTRPFAQRCWLCREWALRRTSALVLSICLRG